MMLNATLAQLENEQIIRPALDIEPTYLFKHTLMQEAAYQSVLQKQRREIHRRVAQAIEELYPDRLDESAAQLAQHYAAANDDARALEYAARAGDLAARMYALPEALTHYTFALTLAQRSNLNATRLLRARGLVFEGLGNYDQARADQVAALESARASQDHLAEWQALIDLGKVWAEHDYRKTGEYFQQAFELAQHIGEPATLAHSLNRMGNWYVNVERPLEARQQIEQALNIFRQLQDRHGIAQTLDLLGMTNSIAGDMKQGIACFRQAIALFRELNEQVDMVSSMTSLALGCAGFQTTHIVQALPSIAEGERSVSAALEIARETGWRSAEAFAWIVLGICQGSRGDFTRALESAQNGLTVAEEIGHRQWTVYARGALGIIHAHLFDVARARQYLEEALTLAKALDSWHWIRTLSGFLASTCILQHDLERAQTVLVQVPGADDPPQTLGHRSVYCARVELALAQGNPGQAMQLIDQLIATAAHAEPNGENILSVSLLRGQSFTALQRWDDAFIALNGAKKIAEEQGALTWLWHIELALAQIETQRGHSGSARDHRTLARAAIDYIAAHTPPNLRESFLNSLDVRTVMATDPH